MMRFIAAAACALLSLGSLSRLIAADDSPAEPNFEQHVRPILKAHCFYCHGEGGEKESGLDMRLRRWIVEGGDSGPAVIAGQPDESLLLARVEAGEMPPGDGKQLPSEDIEILRRWIAAGAPTLRPEPEVASDEHLFTYEERGYWAFQAIQRPEVPQVTGPAAEQVRTPIDAFVLERLAKAAAEAGAPPEASLLSPEADRRTLARRAYVDLLGLPPTPEQLEAFVNDPAPDAYEKLIERLLASPHYGERWGRHWLDVAGYADSEGYTDDDAVRPYAYRYRDYVIRSFNADKPFDLFVQEQLAGDEMVPLPHTNLSEDAIEKLTATGFLRMAPDGTGSPGVEQPAARNQVVADTLQIVGGALLGITMHCAQCHDHRYDPIPHVDYFRMRAIFEPALSPEFWRPPAARRLSLYTDEDRKQAAVIEAEAAAVDQQRQEKVKEFIQRTLEEQLAEVPEEVREPLRVAYETAAKDRSPEQEKLLMQHPTVGNISVGSLYLYDGIRRQKVARLDAERKAKTEKLVAAVVAREIERAPEDQREALRAASQVAADQRTPEQQALLNQYPGVLATAETLAQFDPDAAAELEADKRLADELREFQAAETLKQLSEQAAQIRARKPTEHFLRVLTETPGQVPVTRVFYRGDIQQPKDEVSPGDLSILAAALSPAVSETAIPADDPELPTTGRRLAFARHLTSGQHPLFARVAVNRIWLHHLGRGIVNTPGDFGVLGDPPTHPELLDWLATEFMRNGWSVKQMHRLIMHSHVYRQASTRRPEIEAFDPDNQLYGRMGMRRLESETLRDVLLHVSGTLHTPMYGEPVPVMEDEVGQIVIGRENLDGERKPADAIDLAGEQYRRSVYVQVRRSRTLSMFETFDAPTMDPHCIRRSESTVALQSLMLMNNTFIIEQAEKVAERTEKVCGPEAARQVEYIWQLLFCRTPRDEEAQAALEFLARQREAFQAQQPDSKPEDHGRSALASLCQALISSNEFLYID